MTVNDESTPILKEVKPINFLFFRTETKVSGLADVVPVARELFKEAVQQDLQITGPIHWHYFGFSGEVDQRFALEVALPVAEVISEYDGPYHFKRTEPFKCVSLLHEGGWNDLPQSYEKLMRFIHEQKLKSILMNREVYVNADFKHPEANITEIQIGIK